VDVPGTLGLESPLAGAFSGDKLRAMTRGSASRERKSCEAFILPGCHMGQLVRRVGQGILYPEGSEGASGH
jgi:hypothetical protein